MKHLTRIIKAGIVPEKLILDGKASTFAKLLFPILTLYAEPDETFEEWEFNVAECNERLLPIGREKIFTVLQEINSLRYIEDFETPGGAKVIFTFPDWILKIITLDTSFTERREINIPTEPTPTKEPPVHKSAPASGYKEKTAYKETKCAQCKGKIAKKQKYYAVNYAGPKLCGKCAGGNASEPEKTEQLEDIKLPENWGEMVPLEKASPSALFEGNPRLPHQPSMIGLIGSDLSFQIVKELNSRGHLAGDAIEVIGCIRGIIVDYLEYMPEVG